MVKQNNNYDTIRDKLIKSMSKRFVQNANNLNNILKDAQSITNHEAIIETTIDKYNYKGKNFNPTYLPVIIAMALEELKDTMNNNDLLAMKTKEIAFEFKQREDSILKENLDIILNYMKNSSKECKEAEEKFTLSIDNWDKGYNDGYDEAINALEDKIKEMTK